MSFAPVLPVLPVLLAVLIAALPAFAPLTASSARPAPLVPIAARGSPSVYIVLPRGGQRGTELTVTFHGERLADAAGVHFYEPGIELLSIEAPDEASAVAKLRIAPDCELGQHLLRLRTRSGISELRSFWVGPFPCVDEVEPNDSLEESQRIERNVTVHGTAATEDADYFAIEMKAGERLSAEVEGIRLGETLFDPFVAILDERRFELSSCDDSSLFKQDPVTSCVVPADGRYFVLIRESSYAGNDACRYRLHVGTFPRPLVAFPAGARPGAELTLKLLGDVRGDIELPLKLAENARNDSTVWPVQDGVFAPSGLPIRVAPLEPFAEIEPNDEPLTATPASHAGAIAFDGLLQSPGDVDFVRFTAKKDQPLHVRVHGRSIRSPLDSVISIHALDGTQLDATDDVIGLDSYMQFSPPADGEYLIRLADHLGGGGPTYVWRIVVAPVGPSLHLEIPRFGRDSQARQTVSVPRGNRYATTLQVKRGAFGGDVDVIAEGLPPGVSLTAVKFPASLDTTLLMFESAADAEISGALVDLAAHAPPQLRGRLRQRIELVVAPPNDTSFYDVSIDRLAVAVTEEAPFKLDVVPPRAPLVQYGAINLRVVATRREGFDAPIVCRMLWLPPNVGAQPTVTIPQGQSETLYTMNANGEAPLGEWQLAVLGEAESGRGVVLASSALTPLTIAPPFVSVRLDLAAVEQGQKTQVVANVEPVTPFEGKAKMWLHGLPPNAATKEHEFAAGDTTLVFDVTTAADTPAGKHATLFVQVDIVRDGETIIHYLGGGGTLRVDPPADHGAGAVVEAAPAPEPAAEGGAAEPKKPLSRLEQLRQEAQQRQERGGERP